MSNRTANANKAISARWAEEQQLLNEGKGTRDWTSDQQRDILDRGKAYDDNGKAFEGHHMKSVEKYPEYQGDLGNIQFLSRPEHNSAHNGSFQNPTNGYFNPFTGETLDFSDNKYKPCEIITLSDPVVVLNATSKELSEGIDNSAVDSEDTKQPPVRDAPVKEIKSEATPQKPQIKTSPPVNESPKIEKSGFREGLKRFAESVKEFAVQHPVLTEVVKVVGVATAVYLLDRVASSGGGSGGGGSDYTSPTDSYDDTYSDASEFDDSAGEDSDAAMEQEGRGKGSPKAPHDTSGYTRTRNGKVEHVRGYSTGENRDE
jgi:hypothetical protein